MTLEKEAFSKYYGKRIKCWLTAFSPFTTMFFTLPKTNFNFSVTFILLSANAFNAFLKHLSFDKEFNKENVRNKLHCISKHI